MSETVLLCYIPFEHICVCSLYAAIHHVVKKNDSRNCLVIDNNLSQLAMLLIS